MIYGVTLVAVVLLTLLYVAYQRSPSGSDVIGHSLGILLGMLGGTSYGIYLHQPHLLWSSSRWPLFASTSVGSIVGLVAAIYTREWWSKPLAKLLQWAAPRIRRRLTRFSIRSLLVLTTLLCLFLGLYMSTYWRQKRAVDLLLGQGVEVEYRWPRRNGRLTPIARLSKTIGPDHFLTPCRVAGYKDESLTDDRLVGLRQLFHIKSLNFQNTGVTTNVLSLLGSRNKLTHFMLLRNKDLPSDDGTGLALLNECEHLEWLDLENVAVPDTGLSFLRKCPHIHTLQFSHIQIDDDDVTMIAELIGLRHLVLSYTMISDRGLQQLARLQNLVSLMLGNTEISDAGLKYVAELPKLERLGLARTEISDDGLKWLSNSSQLKILDLSSTHITDSGLEYLESLNHLRGIQLRGTKITDKGVKKLQRTLSNCNILK